MKTKVFFRPRNPRVQTRVNHLGWETGLTGWAVRSWALQARCCGPLSSSQRGALVKTARRTLKKVAFLQVDLPRGPVRTAKPLGTRMGKGKGKPVDHRGWLNQGQSLLRLRGSIVHLGRLAGLTKRSSHRLELVRTFF